VIRVGRLFSYPVKSCAGIELTTAQVTATGLAWDRRWMVVGGDGAFLSQREHPWLALVRVRLDEGNLVLSAPRRPEIRVAFDTNVSVIARVRVWSDECEALDEGRAAAEWFSELLGVTARLVRLAGDDARPLGTPSAQPGDRVSFADAYPFLLLSEASLDGLNRRLALPVPMDRFRPNIVVVGCGPHAEDEWRQLRMGDVDFRVVKACARCVITTTDQETAERSPEPLRTLATYRLRDGKVMFGQNLIHGGAGTITVGDPVIVLGSRQMPEWS
jgi:uncharacterized protein YcbX